MKVNELMKYLMYMEPDAVIDISSDEEGNSYGDISNSFAEGQLLDGTKVYTLYPENCEDPLDRYLINKIPPKEEKSE
tara:strand:+ start:1083 stop:1313 length:231 start_codon:yes stop_codon:yes gene_type:complete